MKISKIFKALRFSMSFIFLWAFFDKTFGLGFATAGVDAWIKGGSPTTGFLLHGTKGSFAPFFQNLAGVGIVDWFFMIGLLFIGLTLLLNFYLKWGILAGIAMMLLMYLASFPPANNPIIDDHLIYILVLTILAFQDKIKLKE